MKTFLMVLAWGAAIAVSLVIVFVKSPKAAKVSGGQQASEIIKAGGGALSGTITALEGGA